MLKNGDTLTTLIYFANVSAVPAYVKKSSPKFLGMEPYTKKFLVFQEGGTAGETKLKVDSTYTVDYVTDFTGTPTPALVSASQAATFMGITKEGLLWFQYTSGGTVNLYLPMEAILCITSTNNIFLSPTMIRTLIG